MTERPANDEAPPLRDIEKAVAFWLARQEVDPAARYDPAFTAWLASSAEHQIAWTRGQAVWGQAPADVLADLLGGALRDDAMTARPPIWPKALIAASLAGAALLGGMAWKLLPLNGQHAVDRQEVAAVSPVLRLATSEGGKLTRRLSDGTRVELDADSALEIAITPQSRRLRLTRGQAYFEVAADPQRRPFSVAAGDQVIVDRGTSFGASLDGDLVTVTLVSGSVAVGRVGRAPQFTLAPGQALEVRQDRGAVKPVKLGQALAWRTGYVEFSNTPLTEAVEVLNRGGGRRLVIGDQAAGKLQVSGRFKLGDNERFVRAAAALLPIRAQRRGEDLVIRSTGISSKAP
jgi:transmembrane sensor